ncbi:hypothetical protein [Microbacterium lushaniae]|uniref:Uncharacterized protein n=1 Tax=Microbacterium lushaniae TaxID=2614639 RepID=A0A5J6L4Y9_9MICO|nr:hypothetical protein [Microbacterium lushaniae]QEW03618.1 hypothetical protein F6J85_11270 [Microbacterium lushaniae]
MIITPGGRDTELRARLLAWDILGVYADADRPADDAEYDDLIRPIMTWLGEGADADEVSARLVRFLRADYGLTVSDEKAEVEFARTLVEWWRAAAG